MALPLGQGLEVGAAQVIGDEPGKFLLFARRRELLDDGLARCVRHVGLNLFAQGALADGGQPVTQAAEGLLSASELRAEAIKVSEHPVIDEADQPIEFEQRVLQRRRGQERLGVNARQRLLEGLGDDVAGFVDVAQAMRFVEDDQVPVDALDIVSLGLRELVGTDDRTGGEQERVPLLLFADRVVAFGFEDQPLQAELVLQLLVPLLAQVRWNDDEHLPPPFRPALGDDQAGFDGLA